MSCVQEFRSGEKVWEVVTVDMRDTEVGFDQKSNREE